MSCFGPSFGHVFSQFGLKLVWRIGELQDRINISISVRVQKKKKETDS